MIVKVIKAGPAGSEGALMSYVADLKRESERQGEYALDQRHGGEKVEWARTVNTGVDDPHWAIEAIRQHNAQNTRAHRVSRNEHIIVSFREDEKPTREQMAEIEDRLCRAIGFGDHPRLSAVHKPDGKQVDNWHLHIVVSRIDPTTLAAEHPRHNHFSLQAEAARLELDLGLIQERKTLLYRERQEIEERQRQSLDRAHEARHSEPQRVRQIDELKVSHGKLSHSRQAHEARHGGDHHRDSMRNPFAQAPAARQALQQPALSRGSPRGGQPDLGARIIARRETPQPAPGLAARAIARMQQNEDPLRRAEHETEQALRREKDRERGGWER